MGRHHQGPPYSVMALRYQKPMSCYRLLLKISISQLGFFLVGIKFSIDKSILI
nr:MAG TPA: hypothetical protein [Caudoviricetes sp.]